MNLSELNNIELNIDFNNPGEWSKPIKLTSYFLSFVLSCGIFWYFLINGQNEVFDTSVSKEATLKASFEGKQKISAQLKGYQDQLVEIENSLFDVLKQLPSDSEIAILLTDISTLGRSSGLTFELFKPESKINKDFYSIIPIKIRVKGEYNEIASFVSGLASMPRIVTIHDVQLMPFVVKNEKNDKNNNKSTKLTLEATIKTYSELPKDEKSTSQSSTLKSKAVK